MQLYVSLLVIPLGIASLLILVIPGSLGVFAGIAAAMLYYAILTIRASDWT